MKNRNRGELSRTGKEPGLPFLGAAFLLPLICAAAYLNMGQSSCGGGGSPPPPPPDFTVSKNTEGEAGNGLSQRSTVSGDGQKVVFLSNSTNLGPITPVQSFHVFLRDFVTNQTTLISYWQDGLASPGRITQDGGHIVYWDREFVDPTMGPCALVVRDLETNSDEIVGGEYTYECSTSLAEVSASNGAQLIAFITELALDAADTNDASDVYLKDRSAATLTRVSVPAAGGEYEHAEAPELSADGQWLKFWAREQGEDVVVLKQLVPPGQEFKLYGFLASASASMDATGSKVLYYSQAPLAPAGLFLFDRVAGSHELVSIDAFGNPGDCWAGVISGNGRYVAFRCDAPMTSHGANDQVYVRDLQEGWTKLASIDHTGVPGEFGSMNRSFSTPEAMPYDGSAVILTTPATNLHSGQGGTEQIVRVPSVYWDEGDVCASDDTTCDGVDDDCDGQIDEDYVSQGTNCGVGACVATGFTACSNGQIVDSCVPWPPGVGDVVCDGIDEDCDGTIDEDAGPIQVTCQIGGCTAFATGPCGFTPNCTAMGVCVSEAACADAIDNDGDNLVDCWDSDCSTDPNCANSAPTLSAVPPQQVTVGQILRLTLTGSDPDGEPVTFSATPLPLPANATLQGDTGEFTFAPTLAQVSSFALDFSASDGRDSATQTTVITVLAPQPGGTTDVEGVLLDAALEANGESIAVVGATIRDLSSGAPPVTTGMDGRFVLTGLTPGQVTLEFDGSTAAPPPPPADQDLTYGSYRATKTVELGTTLEMPQPVYLPYIDEGASVNYDPDSTGDAILTNATLGITAEIQPGSIVDEFGIPPAGMVTFTLSSVPPEFTPGALPDTLNPSTVITIQPMGWTFMEPAPITFPNELNLAPGSEVDIWSLDHSTGEFFVAGQGQVTPDGTQITTIPGTGGIVETSWHFPAPPGPGGGGGDDGTGDGGASGGGGAGAGSGGGGDGDEGTPNDPDDEDPDAPPEEDDCDGIGSSMALAKGKISVDIKLPSYKVLSDPVAHTLVYDSLRAFPYYLFPVNTKILVRSAVPPIISYDTTVGGVYSNNRRYIDTDGFFEGVDEPFRVVLGVDGSEYETSLLPVELRVTSHYPNPVTGTDATFGTVIDRSLPVINGRNSPFGAGWGWSGLRRLVPVGAGGVDRLMIDGSGGYRIFRFDNGDFVSPPGDASTLVANGDGTTTLQRTDGVETHFDVSGAQERIVFPNANVWSYYYTEGRLSSIEDPLGGTTFINYEGEFISEVIDPANRKTEFDHENGDLIRVKFPDGSKREFGYDDRHLMDSETSARGFTKYRHFDVAGRLDGVILEDTSERHVTVAATHGFIPPNSSLGLTKETPAPFVRPDRVTTVADAEERVQTFEIGPYGKVSKLTNAAGLETTMERDSDGHILHIVRPSGQEFTMQYYVSNKKLHTRTDNVLGGTTTFTYEPVHNKVETITDALMHETKFEYYPSGDLKKVTSPRLREVNMTYYPDGNVETITDPLAQVTRFDYDSDGNLATVTVAAGSELRINSFVNSSSGYARVVTNPLLEELTILRDQWNRPTSLTDHAGQTTEATYDAAGNLATVTPPFSLPPEPVHTFLYDERDWNTAYVPPELMGQDLRTTRARNGEKQLELESLAGGRSISYGYDTAGRLETTTIERGTYTIDYHPGTGQVESITDPDQEALSFDYQGARVRRVSRNGEKGVAYSYKPTGQLDALGVVAPGAGCDPNAVATWPADGTAADPVGGHHGVTNGDVTYVQGIDGQAFSFDGSGDWVEANIPVDGLATLTFSLWFRRSAPGGDPIAHMRARAPSTRESFFLAIEGDGTIRVGFDGGSSVDTPTGGWNDGEWHHVVAIKEPFQWSLYVDGAEETAAAADNLPFETSGELFLGRTSTGNSLFTGEIDGFTVYDRAPSAAEIAQWYADLSAGPCGQDEVLAQIDHMYDADGAVKQAHDVAMTYYDATGLLKTIELGDLTKTFTYTAFGEIFTESTEVGATLTNVHQISYDVHNPLGRVSRKTETIGQGVAVTHDYVYDDAGRLEKVLVGGALAEEYTYDDNGNRLAALGISPIDYDEQDRLERYGDNVYSYRDSGELLTKTESDGQTTYDYDELGNLLSVVLPNNSVIEYEIDALNRRVGRKFDGQVTHRWIYQDQLNPVAELDADGNLVALFIYGTSQHVPDAMIKNDTRYLFVTDRVGSVRLVVNAETGAVVQSIDYDAWGNVMLANNLGFQPFGFAGGLYDRDTKLVRFGARDYDPEVGRWTAKDRTGFAGGQANLYVYVGNDPINYMDPEGRFWQYAGAAVAAAVMFWAFRFMKYGCTAERAAEDFEEAGDKVEQLQNACSGEEGLFETFDDPKIPLEERMKIRRECRAAMYDAIQHGNFRALEGASNFGKSTPPSRPKLPPR